MKESLSSHRTERPGVLVVGGCGNLGSELVPRLVDEGFQVVVTTRRVASPLWAGAAVVTEADPSQKEGLDRILDEIEHSSPNLLSVVFLNGDFAMDGGVGTAAFVANLRSMLDANLVPAAAVLSRLVPILTRNESSRAVFVSAMAAQSSFAGGGAYSISKGALESLARQIDLEYEPMGLKSLVLRPGVIGPGADEISPQELSQSILKELYECVAQSGPTSIHQGAQ